MRGFEKHFYQGAPENYSEAHKKEELIRIDTMWFSPMIAEENANDDEDVHQKEAERRLDLHRKKDPKRDNPGNRIKIIGYDGNSDYKDLDHLRSTPGDVVTCFNNKEQVLFSVFIHAPFKKQLEEEIDDKKNSSSIVFQARFKNTSYQSDFSTLAIFGRDSDHNSWNIILEKSKKYRNEEALKWDLFLSPHHSSWSFFNNRPQKENPEPKATSLEVLDYKRTNAKVIASSKEILDDADNPPHYEAKREYVKKVTAVNFLNTTTYNVVDKTPQPIIFEVTSLGIVKPKQAEGTARTAGTAGLGIVNSPSKYGNGKI